MECQFHQFRESDNGSVHGENKIIAKPGKSRVLAFVLYGLLVLLLSILLMVTGIKFNQLNKEIADVKVQLKRFSQGGKASASSSTQGGRTLETVLLQELAPVRGTCGNGWSSFQRSCYLLSTSPVSWSKAEEQCLAHGGHLLVLNNVEELDYVSGIVELRYHYWIGLVEREPEGHWSWVDGTDFHSTQTFWDMGQPDNWSDRVNGEDCGQLHASERRKRKMWKRRDCSMLHQYICEAAVTL